MKLIGIGMIGNSNYIRIIFSGSIQEGKSKKNYSVSSKTNLRTYHWVGHSKLKELFINDLFDRKQMIEDLESGLTGAHKEN